jgi:hypothetical protein
MSNDHPENRHQFEDRFAERVVDPDDYNRTQRFKEIHQARQRVTDYMAKFEDRMLDNDRKHTPGTAPTFAHEQLAFRVALYIMELLPLLEKKGGDDPYMSEHFSEASPVDDLQQFAFRSGMLREHTDKRRNKEDRKTSTAVRVTTSLRVFQIANKAYADLGMDLEIAEEDGDAGFDYSDILEEGPPGERDAPEIEGAASKEGITDE